MERSSRFSAACRSRVRTGGRLRDNGTVRRRVLLLSFALLAAVVGVVVTTTTASAANDPGLSHQWNLDKIGAPTAWTTGDGQGVTIAIVDSGVHLTHEDLVGKLLPGRNYVTPNQPPADDNGHGTHVAGIAAAMTNNGRGIAGTAPGAKILPIKVLDANGEGTYGNAAAGIRWAADNGAHIVNLSLGSTVSTLIGSPSVFVDAIRYASGKGVICVVAAGNDFVLSSDFSDEPAIVVSATTTSDRAATYSNGVGNAESGMAAPGGDANADKPEFDIISTYWPHTETDAFGKKHEYGLYATAAGTSMASPHVAGAAAVLRSLGLSPQATVERLLATAKDLGDPGKDGVFGHGRLDLAKAVSGLTPTATTTGTGGTGSGGTTATTRRSPATGTAGRGSPGSPPSSPSSGPGASDGSRTAPLVGDGPPSLDGNAGEAADAVAAARPLALDAASDPSPPPDTDETPWPAALVALLALGAVMARLRRTRRV